jgi:hypothetical protein
MAAAAKGVSGQKISEVDSDRLWRDRVSQELMYQQKWVDEYGFMLKDEKRARLMMTGSASFSHGSNSSAVASPMITSSSKKSSLKFSSTPSVGGMQSTHQVSFKVLPSPEIKNDPSPFRRRRHPM